MSKHIIVVMEIIQSYLTKDDINFILPTGNAYLCIFIRVSRYVVNYSLFHRQSVIN